MILHGFIHRLVDNRMVPCRCRGVLLYHAECAGFVKMEISASGIFRVEPFQHRLCGDSPSADGGNVPRPAAGTTPYPRRWAKRKDNLRFSFLFELLPFPCFLIWRRPETGDRFEKEERQRIFPLIRTDLLRVRPFLLPIRSSVTLLLHISATLRRRYV